MQSNQLSHAIISVKNLNTQFGSQIIHNNLSLDIYANEILVIVGASGSGKSVLFNFLTRLSIPQNGSVEYNQNITAGILFQTGGLLSSLTVIENVVFPLTEAYHLSYDEAYQKAKEKLNVVNIKTEDFDKLPSQLSGGMIKRVGLARSMIHNPKVLFLDEPTAGLDPIGAEDFDQLLCNIKESFGLTCVMITHDLHSIFSIADRVGVLVNKKISIGTLKEILQNNDPWIQKYFGNERAQVFRLWKNL